MSSPENSAENIYNNGKSNSSNDGAASVIMISDVCENQPVAMPINAVANIFRQLSRDEIDVCKLVCKQWKQVIDTYSKTLPKRQIDVLMLTTCHEFAAFARYGLIYKKFAVKKYFRYREIRSGETESTELVTLPHNPTGRFLCGRPIPNVSSLPEATPFSQFENNHCIICSASYRPMVFDRIGKLHNEYERKCFTPPLVYYERLAWLLRDSEIKSLVFCKFTFTDFFVEKFKMFLAPDGPLCVKQVTLHCCKMSYIHTHEFHNLLGDHIHAERYFIENLRFCLPKHVSGDFLLKPGIKQAKLIHIGQCLNRANTEIRFAVNDQDFKRLIDDLVREDRRKGVQVDRQFFGIRDSAITESTMNLYKRNFYEAHADKQKSMYKQVLFARRRFIAPEMNSPPPMPVDDEEEEIGDVML